MSDKQPLTNNDKPETKDQKKVTQIVDHMYEQDQYSQWLGIQRLEDGLGKSVLQMTVRKEMTNGHGTAHGGITYSLSDSAFAFACNSQGRKAVSIETSISHLAPVKVGDVLTATASEENLGNRISIYNVIVVNQDSQRVALFKGTAYRTKEEWTFLDQ